MQSDGSGAVAAPAVERSGAPTARDWWTATKEDWASPGEWTVWRVLGLAFLVLVLAGVAFWVTRPGRLLGGVPPLTALSVYANAGQGIFVYELYEDPAGDTARLRATLQAAYNERKGQSQAQTTTVLILRRMAPVTPFITGGGDPGGPDVMARAVVGQQRREAFLRPREGAPLEPVTLRW